MFGWIPLCLLILAAVPARKAIIVAYLIGWLFLPQAGYALPGLPDYSRMTAVNGVILLGLIAFDWRGISRFRPRFFDIPMGIWCLCPLFSSLSNDLGPYDGISGVMEFFLMWGTPYLIGRVYFNDTASIRMLAIGVFIGGLIYMPLCWWEMRMSPHLHRTIYGFNPTKFERAVRLGGYRPMMFLKHGIEVGLWMGVTAMTGMVLWLSGSVKKVAGAPMSVLAPMLLITAALCRSMNALVLVSIGLACLFAAKYFGGRFALLVLFLAPSVYVGVRGSRVWHPQPIIDYMRRIDPDRADSFSSRINQEDILTRKAWNRPWFGWGTYGRNRYYDDKGHHTCVTDSLWIITFGQRGLVGLVSLGLSFLIPALLLWRRLGAGGWWTQWGAAAGVLAVGMTLYVGDCLMNAMLNPLYHLMAGAVMGVALRLRVVRRPLESRSAAVQQRSAQPVVPSYRREACAVLPARRADLFVGALDER